MKPRDVLLIIMLLMLVGVFALFKIGHARAHDGYEPVCCNNVHCKPIPAPSRQGAYWVLPDGRRFQAGSTRHSSVIGKTGFHLCEWQLGEPIPSNYERSQIVQPIGQPVCLYVPDAEH